MRFKLFIFVLILTTCLFFGCGNSEETSSNTTQTQVTVTFNDISSRILQPKCVACHSSSQSSGGVDLSSYTSVMRVVIANSPNSSSLYRVTSSGSMPPGGPQLSASELQTIYQWISNGANR